MDKTKQTAKHMVPRKSNSLGIEFIYHVAGSHSEYNDLAKRVGPDKQPIDACLADAVEKQVQHVMNTEFRDLFLHGRDADSEKGLTEFKGVDSVTGIARNMKEIEKTNAKGEKTKLTIPDESEKEYFNRVCAQLNVKPEHFNALAQAAADLVKFDPSKAEPTTRKPAAIAKVYLEKADKVFADGTLEKALARIKKDTGQTVEITGDNTKDREPLARLIKTHCEWMVSKTAY